MYYMNTLQKRMLLFLIGCMGSRLLLVYIAKNSSPQVLKYMGYLTLLPAIGFMYIFLTGSRKTGPEVFGEQIWWNHLRPIHSLLYFIFSYNAILGYKYAWMYLMVDVTLGFIGFVLHHINI